MIVVHHIMGDKATWLLSITLPLKPYPYSLPFCPTILLHLCLAMSVTGLDGLSAARHSPPYAAWCLAHQQQSVLANICSAVPPQAISASMNSTPSAAWCLAHQQQPMLANMCRVCAATDLCSVDGQQCPFGNAAFASHFAHCLTCL